MDNAASHLLMALTLFRVLYFLNSGYSLPFDIVGCIY